MKVTEFSNMIKEVLTNAPSNKDMHKIASHMLSIIKGHEIVIESTRLMDEAQNSSIHRIKMVDYEEGPVPEELCTVCSDSEVDEFHGCGACFDSDNDSDCENCVVDKIFKEYAKLTGQINQE